jgi:hypothetical protein
MREALSSPIEELGRMGREGARRVAERHDARIEARKLSTLFATGSTSGAAASQPDLARFGNIPGAANPELIR